MFGRNRIADLEAKVDDLEHERRNLLRVLRSVEVGEVSIENQMRGLRNFYADEFAEIERQEEWSQRPILVRRLRNDDIRRISESPQPAPGAKGSDGLHGVPALFARFRGDLTDGRCDPREYEARSE